jgi:hypothetical protein
MMARPVSWFKLNYTGLGVQDRSSPPSIGITAPVT